MMKIFRHEMPLVKGQSEEIHDQRRLAIVSAIGALHLLFTHQSQLY